MRIGVRVSVLIGVVAVTAAACGSSNESLFDQGPDDGLTDGSAPSSDGGGFTQTDGGKTPPVNCKPKSCADFGATCGMKEDGCGGLNDCGQCNAPEKCGGGGSPSTCGAGFTCTPKTCEQIGASCGPASDGCGGLIDCGTCTSPQTCGGGGQHSKCGGNNGCVPQTCESRGFNCGLAGDGCGGTINCGTCAPDKSCGGGGQPSKCGGTVTDGGVSNCTPKTCQQLGVTCGPAGNGCGGLIQCGGCTAPATCGGGGVPSKCGGSSGCVPRTCAQAGANCGPIADGCGGSVDCGACNSPQFCGGGGSPSVCGGNSSPCVRRTCEQVGANCGPVADGCGGVVACGTCTAPDICGGGGIPSVCGAGTGQPDAGCTGLCQGQVKCDAGPPTTLTGKVFAPNGITPLYNAVVYVPNAPVLPFTQGVSCTRCGSEVSGKPLVKAWSGTDGSFTLANVPAGANIPLVIQMGRWRRQIVINNVPSCTSTALTPEQTRLPRTKAEGDIPLTAISTGAVDTLECLFRKAGVADSEFTRPDGNGRIRLYQGDTIPEGDLRGHKGQRPSSGTAVSEDVLVNDLNVLNQYDQVILSCEGFESDESPARKGRMVDYTNGGGRVFATHYSYAWLHDQVPFSSTAQWDPGQTNPGNPMTANIDTSFPKGQAFSDWLAHVGALSSANPRQVRIRDPRHDLDAVVAPAQRWLYGANDPSVIGHFTFNTPWGKPPDAQCGRVVFSDFHVTDADANNARFPDACNNNALTAQEKILLFMIFDLGSCIEPDQPPPPPTCTPRTCQQAGANCGPIGNGCGGQINCGTCVPPQTCGGGGTPSQCGGTSCTPRTCAQAGATCGPIGNGCGGQIDCGPCTPPQTCGGGGIPSQCGNPSCIARTCAQAGVTCGPIGNGCGGVVHCGDCEPPQTCGGGGSPGVCGNSTCTPRTCQQAGATCGPIADGCGGIVQCGVCQAGQTCGGGGNPNHCAPGSCSPRTCAQAGATCGPIGDGCGGVIQCGPCDQPGQTCGGGGAPSVCGGCKPLTCSQLGYECGPAGDGCGGVIECGACQAPDTCGGGGVQFKCGRPIIN